MLTALRERGAMSRAELARYVRVSPSTISAVVQELAAGGLIVGTGEPPATRPSTRPGPAGPACG